MKYYGVRFGSGDPRNYTGLSPTFLFFVNMTTGATVAPPTITETYVGTGIYTFSYGVTTPLAFLIDAATTSPGSTGRYVNGQIDPADRTDEYASTLIAIGTTNIAIGTSSVALGVSGIAQGVTLTAIGTSLLAQGVTILAGQTLAWISVGSTASSFGTASADPVDLFGYLKRVVENLEGTSTYLKPSGVMSLRDRTGSVTLAVRTIANSVSLVTKT